LSPEIVLRKTSVRVGKGATVASVAQKYKLSAASVAQWNNVAVSAGFKPKQAVVLYLPQSPSRKSVAAPVRGVAAPKLVRKKRG
jgi:membrane-bound lytic murein transglycosylase D